ncbi:MAG: 1-(5-phosphoribosyl)-5-[(5-phosphoribosylamino)methylideneamino]imidazole-4-carboxamide isomerase [Okeania sp. SIO3C4]|nr:1-(5-phosphoribosyl)-5-[(5-phosphoribosylamino)methylideneamino]imidazole-4-carboxamide isomerase [Okeania sp. SIO3C4]
MIEIIPAIDLIDGKCVRLSQGDYNTKKVYNENPVEVAKEFEGLGIKRLHLVDLDGAKKGQIVNIAVLEAITEATSLIVDFGGGVKTASDVQSVLDAGARWATVGSMAAKEPATFAEWVDTFGADQIMLGADVKGFNIATSGWLETSELHIYDFLKEKLALGIQDVFCTDISKDGMLQGVAVDLYKDLHERFPTMNLIASGGVSAEKDIWEAEKAGCSGVIIGKAIYEGKINLANLLKT